MAPANTQLEFFVKRVESIEGEIKAFNDDKRDIYAEAKSEGFDVKALKTVIARRRIDPAELSEHEAIVETYMAVLQGGTINATRARARSGEHDPDEQDPLAKGGFLHRERATA